MLLISRISAMLSVFLFLATSSLAVNAQADDQKSAVNPLRLSYISGSVSFWRYGADDWVEARINTPLIAGDALYTGNDSELELQAEGRAFIRADDDTQISVVNQTPDFLQLKITSGRLSLDLRSLPSSGYTIEVDTPTAVFTIDHIGYYRLDVDGDVHFITRRGGRATMTSGDGEVMAILPSEEIVIGQGTNMARAETYVAPELDEWDLWNYDRTNNLIDAFSDRYVAPGIAGTRDLDYYGNWRVSDEYGPVWVPDGVPSYWAPYSTGRWVWDPYFQWTWIDDAPWGWAPFHYGRWVHFGGYWAWAPGPVVIRRPVYAPALVAFFGASSHYTTSIGYGGPGLCWIALGWGEPLVPWWGRSGFIGRPWWGGWGGPRIVNNVVVRKTTVVNVTNITYVNSQVTNAIIAMPSDRFGRGHVHEASNRLHVQQMELKHIHGVLPVQPNSLTMVADAPRAVNPPERIISRPVVATRRQQVSKLPWRTETIAPSAAQHHYVPAPKPAVTELRRPEPGTQVGPERVSPPLPPHYRDWKRQAVPASPSAAVREQGGVGTIGSEPARVAPPVTTIPLQGREPATAGTQAVPVMPERQQQVPRAEGTIRQPTQVAPPQITTPSRREGTIRQPTQVSPPQITLPQRMEGTTRQPIQAIPPQITIHQRIEGAPRQQQPTRVVPPQITAPPRMEGTMRQPTQATPPQITMPPRGGREFSSPTIPSRIQGVPQITQPQESRSGLPGIPANRTYRGGPQGNPQQRGPQQGGPQR